MATLEEIVVQLTAETAALKAEMQSATKAVSGATDKMDKAIDEFSKNSSKNTSFFQQSMANMAGFLGSQAVIGAFNLVKDAVGSLANELQKGAEDAIKEEQALTRLNNSLALSGNYSVQAAQDLAAFAGEMEEVTNVGDDVVASNLAVLSSITKLDSEGLKTAQKSALDLSAALGMDLDSATKLVAKGIEGNVSAFKKLGIEIQEGATKSENFKNVTQALATQFGGAAAGAIKNFGGQVTALSNSYGNFVEEMAKSITQNPVVIAMLGEITKIFKSLTQDTSDSAVSLKEGVAKAFIFLVDTANAAVVAVDTFIRLVKGGMLLLLTPIMAVAEAIGAVKSLLSGEIPTDPFAQTKGTFQDMTNVLNEDTTLGNISMKLHNISEAGENAFQKIGDAANVAAPSIDNVKTKTKELSEEQLKAREVMQQWAQGLADQNTALFNSLDIRSQALDAARGNDADADAAYWEEKQALQLERFQAENDALAQARAQNLITETEFANAKTQLTAQHNLAAIKSSQDMLKAQEGFNKKREEDFKSTMSTISSLSASGNKELAAIGKAAAITNATIDGYAAVQKALASAPPPFNFGLAALVGAASAANVAKIAGVGLKSGITEVPKSAGGGNSGDNFPAVLNPGERVVDSQTNQDLKEFLARQNDGGQSVNLNITVMPGTGLNSEQIGNLVEQMNNFFAGGGLRLRGAT